MEKKEFSETDICTKYFTPVLKPAGWGVHSQIREDVALIAGRIIVKDQIELHAKGNALMTSYSIYPIPSLSVVETKYNFNVGIQKVQGYADRLDVGADQCLSD